MDALRWQKIQSIFHEAIKLSDSEQLPFLESQCEHDPDLLCEIRSMLNADAADHILDKGFQQVYYDLINHPLHSVEIENFGPYLIKRLLGKGGMGEVWLAEHSEAGNLIAIKLLPNASLSPVRRTGFQSEIRTLAQLKHPYIARLYDAGEFSDGTPWFAMEYIDGVPLTGYCEQHHLSIPSRLQLFRCVAEAVRYAHAQGFIHLDIKPSNIMVESDGTPRLLDFGVAKRIEHRGIFSRSPNPAFHFITPAYSAPELIQHGDAGVYSDVYSLGVVFYKLLVGRLPVDDTFNPDHLPRLRQIPEKPSIVASVMGGKLGPLPNAAKISKSAWRDLDALCQKSIHPDPLQRYSSVEALLRDVDHFLACEPLEARPKSFHYRFGRFLLRNKRGVAFSAFTILFFIGMAAFFSIQLVKERNSALAEAARTQRIERFLEDLFEGKDDVAGPRKELLVSTILERGVQDAQSLGQDPVAQSDIYMTLGQVYQKLGKLQQADSLFRLALDRRKSVFGLHNIRTGESFLSLGILCIDQAKLDEAEKNIRRALAIEQRFLSPIHPLILKSQAALGRVLIERGQYEAAIGILNQVVKIGKSLDNTSREVADSLSLLGDANLYLSRDNIADLLYKQVLEIKKRTYGFRHPSVAEVLINLGHVQKDLGDYSKAERYYNQALDINRFWYGENHPETADAMTYVASAYYWCNRSKDAAPMLESALKIMISFYGKTHPRVALVLGQSGLVARELKMLDKAESFYRQSADIYRSIYGENHQMYATELGNLAGIFFTRKDFIKAEQMYSKTIDIFSSISEGHMGAATAMIKLGKVLIAQGRYAEAQSKTSASLKILQQQVKPDNYWIQNAQKDLETERHLITQTHTN